MSKIISYSEHNVDRIVQNLRDGGVVIFPTETVYALACRADNPSAVQRIAQIKGREKEKVFAVLAKDSEYIKEFANVDFKVQKLMSEFSPGPITYILDLKNESLFSESAVKDGKTGFRIPDHEIALEILKKCEFPVIATSVNKSGKNPASSVKEIEEDLIDQVDMVLDCGEGAGVASTIISFDDHGKFNILREGSVSAEDLSQIWDEN